MKFNIPSIGYKLKLSKNWTTDVPVESRNFSFTELMIPGYESPVDLDTYYWDSKTDDIVYYPLTYNNITIPKNTILQVDRIFIRKGKKEFDSISFIVTNLPGKELGKKVFGIRARFWVKLDELKNLEFKEIKE